MKLAYEIESSLAQWTNLAISFPRAIILHLKSKQIKQVQIDKLLNVLFALEMQFFSSSFFNNSRHVWNCYLNNSFHCLNTITLFHQHIFLQHLNNVIRNLLLNSNLKGRFKFKIGLV